jgi:hypothetical protein
MEPIIKLMHQGMCTLRWLMFWKNKSPQKFIL